MKKLIAIAVTLLALGIQALPIDTCPVRPMLYPFGSKLGSESYSFCVLDKLNSDLQNVICGMLWENRINRLRIMSRSLEGNLDDAENPLEKSILSKTLKEVNSIGQSVNEICGWIKRKGPQE